MKKSSLEVHFKIINNKKVFIGGNTLFFNFYHSMYVFSFPVHVIVGVVCKCAL